MDALLSLSVFSPLFASGNIFPLFKVYELLLLLPSCVWPFVTPWTAARQASLSSPSPGGCPSSCSLNQWCRPAISSSDTLFSFCPDLSQQQDFSNETSVCIRWPKYWSFRLSISPCTEYSGLLSLRIDWFDLLAVQGTLRSLLSTTGQRHQFFGILTSLWSSSHNCTWPLGRP